MLSVGVHLTPCTGPPGGQGWPFFSAQRTRGVYLQEPAVLMTVAESLELCGLEGSHTQQPGVFLGSEGLVVPVHTAGGTQSNF